MVRKPINTDSQKRTELDTREPWPSTIAVHSEPSTSDSAVVPNHAPGTLQTTVTAPSDTIAILERSGSASISDGEDTGSDWDDSDEEEAIPPVKAEVPAALKVGADGRSTLQAHEKDMVPAALRVGPPDGATRRSQDSQRSAHLPAASWATAADGAEQRHYRPLGSHNPYLHLQQTDQTTLGSENSALIRGDSIAPLRTPDAPTWPPAAIELPSESTPTDEMSKLSLKHLTTRRAGANFHEANRPSELSHPSLLVPSKEETTAVQDNGTNTSYAWGSSLTPSSSDVTKSYNSPNHASQAQGSGQAPRISREPKSWEQEHGDRAENETAPAQERAATNDQKRETAIQLPAEEARLQGVATPSGVNAQYEPPPVLPSRTKAAEDQENAPPKPPRPQASLAQGRPSSGTPAETPSAVARKQRVETYQIKRITWLDYSSATNPRTSPILIQNANGPCPLLALVNALVLTTPSGTDTALVETLRTREQISLGLLLDAVFDELTSGRRGGFAQALPDVSELYAFLLALHTGMNVNPRFVPQTRFLSANDGQCSNSQSINQSRLSSEGGFEQTHEMRLYSTFDIPLIHGWLAPRDSNTYGAFQRSAPTFEDAQNVQFRVEELEDKLRTQGLSPSEQQLFEDIALIKEFLSRWPTQLTQYGLKVLGESLKPGEIAILFRNDHFSTLYKHPHRHQLMTLVTDAGYSTHDEIVWESLVDVSGRGSELFSGDFRPVGGQSSAELSTSGLESSQRTGESTLDSEGRSPWTTVEGRKRSRDGKSAIAQPMVSTGTQQIGVTSASSDLPSTISLLPAESTATAATSTHPSIQEDHDLALALQLQEEEEDRHRRETEARRRENDLSMRFLSQDRQPQVGARVGIPQEIRDRQARPIVPPRRSNINQPISAAGEPAPPPTYEQAASGPQFHPPRGHPASPHAPLQNAYSQQSAYQATASISQARPMLQPSADRRSSGRRGSLNVNQGQGSRRPQDSGMIAGSGSIGPGGMIVNNDRDEKCVIM